MVVPAHAKNDMPAAAASSASSSSGSAFVSSAVGWSCVAYAAYAACRTAYQIRLGAIREYGPVIHEFDPYFNFRATEVSDEKQSCLYHGRAKKGETRNGFTS